MNGMKRSAFTLLELLIALGLLGGLLALAWSLMGTLRLAESRTEGLAGRLRIVRALRDWIEDDLQHLVSSVDRKTAANTSSFPLGAASASDLSADSRTMGSHSRLSPFFQGDPSGFSATLLPSFDPILMMQPWLNDANASDVSPMLPHPDQTIRVEYRALGGEVRTDSAAGNRSQNDARVEDPDRARDETSERDFSDRNSIPRSSSQGLRRTVHGYRKPRVDRSRSDVGEQRQLTTADLYRLTDVDSLGKRDATTSVAATLAGLQRLRFRYSDGHRWHTSWDYSSRGGLPRAIEVCFDLAFPPKSVSSDESPRFRESENGRNASAGDFANRSIADSRTSDSRLDSASAGNGSLDMSNNQSNNQNDYQHRMVFFVEAGSTASQPSGSGRSWRANERSPRGPRERGGTP